MAPDDRQKWRGARTLGQIRFEEGIKSANSNNVDSIYKPVERKNFNFRPFIIPRSLQKELPFKDKPKFIPKDPERVDRVSARKSEEEKKRIESLSLMSALKNEQRRKRLRK